MIAFSVNIDTNKECCDEIFTACGVDPEVYSSSNQRLTITIMDIVCMDKTHGNLNELFLIFLNFVTGD